jgi:leucyl-tRNA synthetase
MGRLYDFAAIEAKWQTYWSDNETFRTPNPGDPGFDATRPKFYVLDMFPYPSGAGLHVGHPLGYIGTDIVARYKRMRGFNVLHPMGFDAFGLPAEQYAVEHGVHPRITTERNVANMRRQLQAFGLSYDWNRELATTDPDYYRWTQWIFLQLWGSYYDQEAGRARPIAQLRAKLESGQLLVGDDAKPILRAEQPTARRWNELTGEEQRQLLEEQRLAYLAEVPVNWCPALGTVLANEEVTAEGRSERGNHPVFKRPLKQWMLRITAYAERLLADLDGVDWPEPIKLMQRNWIGRSEGALVDFAVEGLDEPLSVFTTRPDTLFGATYMVVAPEHPLVQQVTTEAQREAVEVYRRQAASRSEIDRQAETKTKTGVFTGAYAKNPVNGERIPVWIADYVLMGYGTGAIMAVPGHDQRDFEFASTFGLPIVPVVLPDEAWLREQARNAGRPAVEGTLQALRADYLQNVSAYGVAFAGEGKGVNSANDEVSLVDLTTAEAKRTMTAWLERKGLGRFERQYKLRDWLFSRQRYWGEPFPVLHGPDGEIVAVPEGELPVALPPMDDFSPPKSDDPEVPPQPSLSRAPQSWREVELQGKHYVRELNTMPQWAGSCWYYLRFLDPKNGERLVDPEVERYWMGAGAKTGDHVSPGGIDLYVGGAEHAVLHLLYARFWHKLLYDLGHVSTPEPFGRLFNQGYILAAAYTDDRGIYVPAAEVQERDGQYYLGDQPVRREYGKMGKSLKNAINPDDMFGEYGCDTLRLYEMYMGPLETSKPWNTRDIVGVSRFLNRVWRVVFGEAHDEGDGPRVDEGPADETLLRALHRTIKRVTDDMERLRFNTALARLIELNNQLVGRDSLPRTILEPLVLMISPFAPHMAEEIWQALGHEQSLAYADWPVCDERYLVDDEVEYVVQIKGKTRGRVRVPASAGVDQIKEAALGEASIARQLEGKTIRRVIHVPGRLINIVV